MTGFTWITEKGSFTHLVLPAIMWDKTTKGSARCDLLSWQDQPLQARIAVSKPVVRYVKNNS
jgi:hypothetical protein